MAALVGVSLFAYIIKSRNVLIIFLILINVIAILASTFYMLERKVVFSQSNNAEAYESVLANPNCEEIRIDDCYGWMHKSGEGERPLIIFFAGQRETASQVFQENSELDLWKYFEGFNFLMIDYPGYGKSKGLANEKTMFSLAEKVYDYALSRDDVDAENIYVIGLSMGTGVATYLASLHSEIKGLALLAPFSEISNVYNGFFPVFHGPLKSLVRLSLESYKYAQNVEIKPLVIASHADWAIPFSSTERLLPHFPAGVNFIEFEELRHREFWQSDVLRHVQDYLIKTKEKPKKTAYITIDDGPSRENTPQILDILKAHKVKATFFVLPHKNVDDIFERIIAEGHELANHSYSHDYKKLYGNNLSLFEEDIVRAREHFEEKFGITTTSFRFPGGAMGKSKKVVEPRKEIIEKLGYRWFDWNSSTGDTDPSPDGKNPEILANNVVENTWDRQKLVVLMHDAADKTATPEALAIIIERLKEQGYRFDIMRNY